jgi:hypothetical protein
LSAVTGPANPSAAGERVPLVGDLLGDLVAGVIPGGGGCLVELGERGVDLCRALCVVELADGLAELLADLASLVGLGCRPDGDRDGSGCSGDQGDDGEPLRSGRLRLCLALD